MSDPRITPPAMPVRKSDGRCEPFQRSKVAACLRRVLRISGDGDGRTAQELAGAVATFLVSSQTSGPIKTPHIRALLERALSETGHATAAALLRDHARQRDKRRRRVKVLAWKESVGRLSPRRWNKGVLSGRLQKEFELEYTTARMIAGRVEEFVLLLDVRLVTGTLVRELALAQLTAWGLSPRALAVNIPAEGRRH
ncbi:MAG: hypothetical protein HUU22_02660 [Phycisphaerae bacterium]|nr:hypothetical protein [Phycisphaerae bacterium]NUQ44915.1 hypothetical protein [Phycisphaerae bacterium]